MPYLVRLCFKGPAHFGEVGLGLEESSVLLRSDTLFSALYHAWLRLHGSPPPEGLTVTSAFPFTGGDLFFPRPFLRLPGASPETTRRWGKELKGLRFVHHRYFFQWLKGVPFGEGDIQAMLEEEKKLKSAVVTIVRPQVTLDRLTRTSSLYFLGETWFKEGAGLFFLARLPAEDRLPFEQALGFLGDEGIGGRRSHGYGVFSAEVVEFDLEEPHDQNGYLTLSLFYPEEGELEQKKPVAYQLVERTGWLEGAWGWGGLRHKRVLMFAEGSVFKGRVQGSLVDVTPPEFSAHKVYRNGRAFVVGVRIGGEASGGDL